MAQALPAHGGRRRQADGRAWAGRSGWSGIWVSALAAQRHAFRMHGTQVLTAELLQEASDETSNSVITSLQALPSFQLLARLEAEAAMLRDKEDEDKLAKGVAEAVARGVLQDHPRVEPTFQIEAEGKSVRVIADEIRLKLGRAPERGCVVVIQGSSGTGKSTLVKKLQAGMPKAACWSNGNVFRALTLLALRMCPDLKPEKLTHQFVETLISRLEFGKFKGDFDIQIKGLDQDLLVSEIANTLLKEPEVGSFVPMIAAKMQGEVVSFAARAACKMQAAGMNVLMEGRSQSLDYVRTPHRFELSMRDPIAIGYRRAAQRVAGAARDEMMRDAKNVRAALTSALSRLSATEKTMHSKRSQGKAGQICVLARDRSQNGTGLCKLGPDGFPDLANILRLGGPPEVLEDGHVLVVPLRSKCRNVRQNEVLETSLFHFYSYRAGIVWPPPSIRLRAQ
ncbi:unnamed protein product, partial [Symbiodinium necroappetens]